MKTTVLMLSLFLFLNANMAYSEVVVKQYPMVHPKVRAVRPPFIKQPVTAPNPPNGLPLPINTAKGWSDSPYISPDGKRLYFMYSRYDFSTFIKSGGKTMPLPTGPYRDGLHQSATNGFDESDTYMAQKNVNGTWGKISNLGFNGAYGDSSGMEFDNGNAFIWLRGNGKTNDIVISRKKADGTWEAPVDLGPEINDHSAGVMQDNPHISADGKAIWFVSNRAGGLGGKDIWFTYDNDGKWSKPVNVGVPINSAEDEDQFWLPTAGLDVYWSRPGLILHCLSNGSTCAGKPETVHIEGCDYPGEASLTADGQYMYFGCGSTKTFRIQIMYSKKQPDGKWGPATPVD